MYFVDYCHQNGIGVILDWVIAHFPKDGHGPVSYTHLDVYKRQDLLYEDSNWMRSCRLPLER